MCPTGDQRLALAFGAAEAAGVTETWTMPWAYYHGVDATLEQKLDGMQRFSGDVIAPLTAT